MISVNYVSVDIAKAKTEAIVNSLGIETDVYGIICRSIIKATTKPGLQEVFANKKGKVSVGDIFECDSFGLPSKRIINIVSPFKARDRKKTLLKKCVNAIFEYCIKHGIKSVTIPPIGAGANGYTKSDSWWAIVEAAEKFCETNDGDLEIEITLFEPREELIARARQEEMKARRRERPESSGFRGLPSGTLGFIGVSESELCVCESRMAPRETIEMSPEIYDHISNLYDYVHWYMHMRAKQGDRSVYEQTKILNMFLGNYVSSKNGSNLLTGYKKGNSKHPSNKVLFIISVALRMNDFEIDQLFKYHQAALSPIDDDDNFYDKWYKKYSKELDEDIEDHDLWYRVTSRYSESRLTSLYPIKKTK